MRGTELRSQERRTCRVSAPQPAFFPPAGSMPLCTPQAFYLSLNRDWKLVTAFRSPATASACTESIPGSTFPTCCFASCATVHESVRLFAPPPATVCSAPAASTQKPVFRFLPRSIRFCPISAPLWDFYVPLDQSVLPGYPQISPPSEFARFPLAPRFRFYF